jgi:hypothetical protein
MHQGKAGFIAEMDAVIRWVETKKPERERLCYMLRLNAKTLCRPNLRISWYVSCHFVADCEKQRGN